MHKNRKKSVWKEYFEGRRGVPKELLNPKSEDRKAFIKYINALNSFSYQHQEAATSYISDLKAGMKHLDIHCITLGSGFSTLCGFTIEEFGCLFTYLAPSLQIAFPYSPLILAPDQKSKACSIRFKLFLALFRLKVGLSSRSMESLFGWSKSSLREWFETVVLVITGKMKWCGEDFLATRGKEWQLTQLNHWRVLQELKETISLFRYRLKEANQEQLKNKHELICAEDKFLGSLGAVDGTYCVRPRISAAILEDIDVQEDDDSL
jgi:hypothetical protein